MSPLYCSCCFFSVRFTVRNSNDLGGEGCAILETVPEKFCVSKIDGLELKFDFALCDVDRRQHGPRSLIQQTLSGSQEMTGDPSSLHHSLPWKPANRVHRLRSHFWGTNAQTTLISLTKHSCPSTFCSPSHLSSVKPSSLGPGAQGRGWWMLKVLSIR